MRNAMSIACGIFLGESRSLTMGLNLSLRYSASLFRRRTLPYHRLRFGQIVLRIGEIRFQSHGFLELGNRFVKPPLLGKYNAEIVMGFGVSRSDFQGLL